MAPVLPAAQVIVLPAADQPCAPVQLTGGVLIMASVHKAGRGPGHLARTPLAAVSPPPPPAGGQYDFSSATNSALWSTL